MPCLRRTWPLLLMLSPALTAQAASPSVAAVGAAIDAPALFARSCAQCHGLDGSGTGPTVLDRPARNFKEGGFSFGNTPETIARTIAHGIPGSPMPAFEPALSDAERRALAEYVVTLGPPVKEVSEAETLLHVTDRPLVVRGILPPLVEDGPVIARGLLVGTPDGLSFEYAADDVRLLAVRQGDFVKRSDWGGRGGSPLEPLGQVVWREPGSETSQRWMLAHRMPGAPDAEAGDIGVIEHLSPLHAVLRSTRVTDGIARIAYDLHDVGSEGSPLLGSVEESTRLIALGPASGFVRSLEVTLHAPRKTLLALVADAPGRGATVVGVSPRTGDDNLLDKPEDGLVYWYRTTAPDGTLELTGLTKLIGNGNGSFAGDHPEPPSGPALWFTPLGDTPVRLRGDVIKLMAPAWTPEVEAALGLMSDK